MSEQGFKIIAIGVIFTAFLIYKRLKKNSYNLINFKELLENGAMLVDVRSPSEYDSGYIKGAVNIPLDKVATVINKFQDKPSIIVYCRSGNRSGQAKSVLEQNGITNVFNGGGINELNEKLKS